MGAMREYFLTSERLSFSVWREDDLAYAQTLWGDPEVTKYLISGGRMSPEDVRRRLEQEIGTFRAHGIQYWPVFLKGTGEFVGCCGLRPHGDDPQVLEIGVHLVRAHWGKGIATEACGAVINHAFEELDVSCLFAGHNPNNSASARMIRKLGFTYVADEYYPSTGLMHPSYKMVKRFQE